MNKTTIVLIVIVILILALGYMVWQHNKLWKTQSELNKTQFDINDAIRKKFPEIPENKPEIKKEDTQEITENIKEAVLREQGNNNESAEIQPAIENKATENEITDFAMMIRSGKDELVDAGEIQFYENNKTAIENELRKLAKNDIALSEVKKTKRGRHPDDCQCIKCASRRKSAQAIKEEV